MVGLLLAVQPPLADWLAWDVWARLQQLLWLLALAAGAYFATLLLAGLRPHHLQRQP